MTSDTPTFSVQRIARPRRKPNLDAGSIVQVLGPDTVIEVTRLKDGVYSPEDSHAAAIIVAKLLTDYAALKNSSCATNPHVSVNASFVPYGYQMDILVEGKPHSITCRDFGGDHKIPVLIESFIEHAEKAIDAFRKGK